MSVDSIQEHGLQYWRERVFGYALMAMLLLGFAALIPSVWLSIRTNLYVVAIFDSLAYLLVLGLFFSRNRISYNYRAAFLLITGLAVGVVVFYFTGDEGGGLFWMFMIPPLAACYLVFRQGSFSFFEFRIYRRYRLFGGVSS
jgi:hypothetical protein